VGGVLVAQLERHADERKLCCWVHASAASWGLYRTAGFGEVGRFEVDLVGFVGRKTGDGEGGTGTGRGWGVYVFRYMLREAGRDGGGK
jgi:hypothetical protein